jgi:glutaredoxin 3
MAAESRAMPKITIYTTPICPFCVRAKALLRKKGAAFDEVDVFMDSAARDEMENRARGRRSVPQIFIGDRHVGGCDELYSLESAGELDPLLSVA